MLWKFENVIIGGNFLSVIVMLLFFKKFVFLVDNFFRLVLMVGIFVE